MDFVPGFSGDSDHFWREYINKPGFINPGSTLRPYQVLNQASPPSPAAPGPHDVFAPPRLGSRTSRGPSTSFFKDPAKMAA